MREALVLFGLVVVSMVTMRWPFVGVVTILVTAVLRDAMIVETYGHFVRYHGYEVLYIATLVSIGLAHPGRLKDFIPRGLADWGMIGFLAAMVVSALVNGVTVFHHKYIDLFAKAVVLYFLLSRLTDTPRRVAVVAVALMAATTYLTYLAWTNYRAGRMWYARPYYFSSFHDFGLLLVITLPLIGAMLAAKVWLPLRVILFGLIPLYVLVSLRTHSRSSMVGVGLALALLAWYHRKRWYWLVPAIPFVAYAIVHQPQAVSERLTSIWTMETPSGEQDMSIESRFKQMRTAKRIVASNPLFGIGPRMFFARFLDYVPMDDYGAGEKYTMHSVPLLIACEEGLFGVATFAMLVIGTVLNGWRAVRMTRGDPEMRTLCAVAAGAMMGFVAWLGYGLAQPAMWVVNIYATCALAHACRRVAAARVAERAEAAQPTSNVAVPWLPQAAETEVVFS